MILPGDDPEAQAEAVRRWTCGGLVAFPTETVYGLGARADDDAAVAGVFAAKGRPADHPLIVHVADVAAAAAFAGELPPLARRLADAFWPGPVTVIVPRRGALGAAASGGQATIGLRCPDHPVARALIRAAADAGIRGIAAPSANRFGRVSPTTAAHVRDEFGEDLLVLDGGPCPAGIESTIVDCSRGHPVLLRPGVLPRERLEAVLGEPMRAPDALAPRASGTLASHYAPRAVLRLLGGDAIAARLAAGVGLPRGLGVYSRRPMPPVTGVACRAMPGDAATAARDLFAVLRDFDAGGANELWVETPPDEPAWDGVRDRLARAAAPR
jgi:L-threonylcarbamoyladenylate synthase